MTEDKKEMSIIDKVEAVAKRIEEANLKTEELLKTQEQLITRALLSGRSGAGSPEVIADPETAKKEAMKQYFKDTAIGKLIK